MQRQQSFQNNVATLYVIATPIGNLKEVSPRFIEAINDSSAVFCEDTRVSGQLLSYFNLKKPLFSAYENIENQSSEKIIEYLKNGENVAFMSDAGYPGISDPGHLAICKVIKNNFNVVVINGPSALIQSVLASGFDTNHFYFYGFLDARPTVRKKELESLKDFKNTIIFYQSPHKILSCLQDMLEIFGNRNICLCRELTKKFEEYIRGTIEEIIPICETLKGEMVLVVEGNQENTSSSYTLQDCLPLIEKEIASGKKSKDAIKSVATMTGIAKNELYQYYLSQKGDHYE